MSPSEEEQRVHKTIDDPVVIDVRGIETGRRRTVEKLVAEQENAVDNGVHAAVPVHIAPQKLRLSAHRWDA